MRALVVPAAILAAAIAFSLWCGVYVSDRTAAWDQALAAADEAAWREDWRETDLRLREVYGQWQREQAFLHILLAHDELEQAESSFAGAMAVCRAEDGPDLHAMLAQLRAVLAHLAESQEASLKNIL